MILINAGVLGINLERNRNEQCHDSYHPLKRFQSWSTHQRKRGTLSFFYGYFVLEVSCYGIEWDLSWLHSFGSTFETRWHGTRWLWYSRSVSLRNSSPKRRSGGKRYGLKRWKQTKEFQTQLRSYYGYKTRLECLSKCGVVWKPLKFIVHWICFRVF